MSTNSLIKQTTKLIGGSAVAGFGFSFGRDLYRGAKKNKQSIIILLVAVASIAGTYASGLWLARNYRTVAESIFKRIGALAICIPSFAITACVIGLLSALILSITNTNIDLSRIGPIELTIDSSESILANESSAMTAAKREAETQEDHSGASTTNASTLTPLIDFKDDGRIVMSQNTFFGICGSISVFAIGLVIGFGQRARRCNLWESEEANKAFLQKHGLRETNDGMLNDNHTGQAFRIDEATSALITLFPQGTRGKRAYILIDDDGKFVEYTGIRKMGSIPLRSTKPQPSHTETDSDKDTILEAQTPTNQAANSDYTDIADSAPLRSNTTVSESSDISAKSRSLLVIMVFCLWPLSGNNLYLGKYKRAAAFIASFILYILLIAYEGKSSFADGILMCLFFFYLVILPVRFFMALFGAEKDAAGLAVKKW